MKKVGFLLLAVMVLGAVSLGAQTVNVTFIVNTATIPDTLGPNSVVQIRGSESPLTWDGGTGVTLNNIGGDYWMGTAEFPENTAIFYKIFTNAEWDNMFAGAPGEHDGWEANLADASTNRILNTGTTDTTLMLQFANGWELGKEQYWRPYTTNDSTFVVWVRVNVAGWGDFNNSYQIGLRGSNQTDWGQTGELSWGPTYLLNQESDHANNPRYPGGFFYSGAIHVPNKYAGANLQYKVVVHNSGADLGEDWGNMVINSNREDVITMSGNDTTVYWFWLDNMKPIVKAHADSMVVTFNADMAKAITNKGFAHGDTLLVRSGYFGTAKAVQTKTMLRQGLSTVYSVVDTIIATAGDYLDYQYYSVRNGIEYREVFYNFYYDGLNAAEAERRVQMNLADGMTIDDIVDSKSDLHRMPLFQNTSLLAQNVLVTYTCDLRPAYYQVTLGGDTLMDIQSNVDIDDAEDINILGLAINGPATGGWAGWGGSLMDATHTMYDDGTHGDVTAGDTVYAIQFAYSPDSTDVVGQEFKFGIGGGDNEGGYGNNHIENIDDTNPTATIASYFGSIDPVFYDMFNFDTGTAVEQLDNGVPGTFALDKNYPNPFNPETSIRYHLPANVNVKLTIYNILGERVATLVDKKQSAGSYVATWDGTDHRGIKVSSGLYIYKIQAGDFTATNKMLMMK